MDPKRIQIDTGDDKKEEVKIDLDNTNRPVILWTGKQKRNKK